MFAMSPTGGPRGYLLAGSGTAGSISVQPRPGGRAAGPQARFAGRRRMLPGAGFGGVSNAGVKAARRMQDNTAANALFSGYRGARGRGGSVMGSMTSAFRDVWKWTGQPMAARKSAFMQPGRMTQFLGTGAGAEFAARYGGEVGTASFREAAFKASREAGMHKGLARQVRGRRGAVLAAGAVAAGGISWAGGGLFATAGGIAATVGTSRFLRGAGRGGFVSGALGLAAGMGANYMLGGRMATMSAPSPAMARGPYTF